MKVERFINFDKNEFYSGLFSAIGSFGVVNGLLEYKKEVNANVTTYKTEFNGVEFVAQFTLHKNGVVTRKDYLKNNTKSELVLNKFSSKFYMEGSDYDVYTQFSSWQHESSGAWQKLITQATASTLGVRTCDGATPMMALHNNHTGKSVVFHLVPNAQWKISAKKYFVGTQEPVLVETGFDDSGLNMKVYAGETIYLPEVIFYDANNKADLDCYKLHEYFNTNYPRKSLPVIFNTWLYCFDNLDVDDMLKQVDTTAELGFEAFMIDAGWFGYDKEWYNSVGDWAENTERGTKGRLKEISDRVRSLGMVFGLWFEPERASKNSHLYKEHPEFFFQGVHQHSALLDFANEKARNYVLELLCEQIDKYNIGWVKFDFNDTALYDQTGCSFYRYLSGQKQFVLDIKKRYPDMYITICSGGGYRMDLNQAMIGDSYWFSDNQGSYDGIEIIKNTLKRMPTGLIERWNTQVYKDGFLKYPNETCGKMLTANDGTWSNVLSVTDNFTKAFMTGGPLGFTCEVASFPKEYKEFWKNYIKEYKTTREFFKDAVCRILVDSADMISIEYSNVDFTKAVVHTFTKNTRAPNIRLYPIVDANKNYEVYSKVVSGAEILEDGVFIPGLIVNDCNILEINEVK